MRTAFIETLCELAAQDERIWLLTGDLGYSVLERFAERIPARYVNMGVAEQNMTGVAAGLALCGKVVFTYSIANFPIMRCLEQIRNDVCYHNLNVKIVAVGGGLAYGAAGYTHHAVEDLAVMRAMPNMRVIAPGDRVETRLATRAIVDCPGPCYLRLGKSRLVIHIHDPEPMFEIGEAIMMQAGSDLTLVSTGGTLEFAMAAASVLGKDGHSIRVLSTPTVQPLDRNAILEAGSETGKIITLEDHGPGGLGSAVADVIAESGLTISLVTMGLNRGSPTVIGSERFLLASQGISVEEIVHTASVLLRKSMRSL